MCAHSDVNPACPNIQFWHPLGRGRIQAEMEAPAPYRVFFFLREFCLPWLWHYLLPEFHLPPQNTASQVLSLVIKIEIVPNNVMCMHKCESANVYMQVCACLSVWHIHVHLCVLFWLERDTDKSCTTRDRYHSHMGAAHVKSACVYLETKHCSSRLASCQCCKLET